MSSHIYRRFRPYITRSTTLSRLPSVTSAGKCTASVNAIELCHAMKPPLFDYFDPDTLGDALSLLGESGGGARILAGGQSLLPLLKVRATKPRRLIDINRIDELNVMSH